MLIFPKSIKVPASYLVWTIPKGLAFNLRNNGPGSGPRLGPDVTVGPEVSIQDDVDVYFFGLCLYFQNLSRYLYHISHGIFLEQCLFMHGTMLLGLAQGGGGLRSISRMILIKFFG